jgi:hypothetical protein
MTRRRRQLRLAAPAALLCIAIVAIFIATAGSTSPSSVRRARAGAHAPGRSGRLAPLRQRHVGTLVAPLQDAAAVPLGAGRVVLLGGLDSSDTSTAAITVLAAGRAERDGELPEAQHDAQGASLEGEVYVFGGGQFSSYDHILRYGPGDGRVSLVGHLPQPASDVAVTSIGFATRPSPRPARR